MEVKLKTTINSAVDNNTLETLDRDNLPLPQQMIREERALAAISWQQGSVDLRCGESSNYTNSLSKKVEVSQDQPLTPVPSCLIMDRCNDPCHNEDPRYRNPANLIPRIGTGKKGCTRWERGWADR